MKTYLWLTALILLGGAVALAVTLSSGEPPQAVEATAPSAVSIFPKALNQ